MRQRAALLVLALAALAATALAASATLRDGVKWRTVSIEALDRKIAAAQRLRERIQNYHQEARIELREISQQVDQVACEAKQAEREALAGVKHHFSIEPGTPPITGCHVPESKFAPRY